MRIPMHMRKLAPPGAVESIARMPIGAPMTLSRMVSVVIVPESAIAAAGASMFASATTIIRSLSAMLNPVRTEIAGCFPVQIIARFSMTTELLSSMLNTPPDATSRVAGPWPLMRTEFAPVTRTGEPSAYWPGPRHTVPPVCCTRRTASSMVSWPLAMRFRRDALRAGAIVAARRWPLVAAVGGLGVAAQRPTARVAHSDDECRAVGPGRESPPMHPWCARRTPSNPRRENPSGRRAAEAHRHAILEQQRGAARGNLDDACQGRIVQILEHRGGAVAGGGQHHVTLAPQTHAQIALAREGAVGERSRATCPPAAVHSA